METKSIRVNVLRPDYEEYQEEINEDIVLNADIMRKMDKLNG